MKLNQPTYIVNDLAQSFDEVPGPPLLKRVSKFWTFVPVLSNQVTASTIQYMLSAGKIFGK